MLKHQIIVDRLSELQKIQILADIRTLSASEYISLGIPEFKVSYLKEYKKDTHQSPNSMANSWNLKAISAYTEELSVEMASEDINVVNVPSPIPKLNLMDEAISEDPMLSSKIVSAYFSSAKRKGLTVCLDGASLDKNDVSKLDKVPNSKFINEFVIRPITESVANDNCDAVIVDADIAVENYECVNSKLLTTVINCNSFKNSRVLVKNIPQEETVSQIASGHICLDGSEVVLKMAVDKYKRLKSGIAEGKVSVSDLDAEVENGTAFSPEELDQAVDRVIDFVFDIASNNKSQITSSPLNYGITKKLAQESVVLLKNNKKILPLAFKKGKVKNSMAFVGDIIANYDGQSEADPNKINEVLSYAINQGLDIQGFFNGYFMRFDRNETLLGELNEGLNNVSCVVLFMGTNDKREHLMQKTENLYLPANQMATLDKIHKMGKKIIAVVSSNHSIDVTFAEKVDALILAPLNTKEGIEAVIDVLLGKVSPSGKLAYSLYENTDNILAKQKYYLDMPNAKVGTFIGYRYYDSANYKVAYPFGFGLSFSKFSYSGLSVQGNNVVFTVKNKGKIAAAEIPQVYIGFYNISERHPKKELVGFDKIFLQPNESMTVTIPMSRFDIFDSKSSKWGIESGQYTIYVGSSLDDIRLSTKVFFGNDVFEPSQTDLCNYLQSETNIISDKYTLEANYKLMKKNVRNIAFGIGSLILAISMFIFSLSSGTVGIFLNVVATILAIASAVFFILEGSDRKKLHDKEREQINAANKAHFKDAEVIPNYSTNQVFANEFDNAGNGEKTAESPMRTKAANYLEFVNESLTFDLAVQQFISFAMARGYKFEEETVREIFSAMAASRLIITKGMTNEMFAGVVKLLSEYFETRMAIDLVDSSYVNDVSALYKFDGIRKQKTALMNTLYAAQTEKSKVHISALAEVRFAELTNYFVTFARYIRNPRNVTTIQTTDENNDIVKINLTENVWFIMNLSFNESLRNMPAYISELASVITIEYTPTVPVPPMSSIIPFSYYQFDYLLDSIKNKYGMSEELWKKIDAVETFVNDSASYTIGNRVCIATERYFAVYKSCGAEDKDALDRVLAARILPSAIVALDSVEDVEKKNLSEKLDVVFGEENTEISKALIRSSGSTVL